MTKTFITTYTNRFSGATVQIKNRITDAVEERDRWKIAEAARRADAKFEKMGHVRYTEWNGKYVIIWDHKTEEIAKH